VNQPLLDTVPPDEVDVLIQRAEEAEVDEMWSYVGKKTAPRWLWHAIDGHVADLHFPVSHRQPKLVAIDKQPNDNVMHLNRSGKADCLAG
jgi:hypothetical protein